MHKALFGVILAGLATAVQAQQVPGMTERYTYTYVTPGAAPDFSGASYVYNNTINLDAVAGTTGTPLSIQPGAQNIVFYGFGGTTVSPPSAPDGTPVVGVTVTSPGGPGNGWGFDYSGGANGFLNPTIIGGRRALSFAGGGFGVLSNGRFLSSVIITGDWSSLANRTAASFGAGYLILDDFAFDGTSTRFTIVTDNYQGINPSISFALLGAGVPEPQSWVLLLAGFALIGAGLRRQRLPEAT